MKQGGHRQAQAKEIAIRTKPKSQTLGGSQTSTLRNALIVAAERFDDHAAEMQKGIDFYAAMTPEELEEYLRPKRGEKEDGAKFVVLNPHPRVFPPLKAQFENNAQDVRDLLALFDGDEDAEHTEITVTSYFADVGPDARP